jgi:hypothetical protein
MRQNAATTSWSQLALSLSVYDCSCGGVHRFAIAAILQGRQVNFFVDCAILRWQVIVVVHCTSRMCILYVSPESMQLAASVMMYFH